MKAQARRKNDDPNAQGLVYTLVLLEGEAAKVVFEKVSKKELQLNPK